jgi:regulator of sirC expression with transglutaminase-like and TPR domain
MGFDTRVTWEKLLMEIRHLQPEDGGSLIPAMVGTNAIIFPSENAEACFRQIHFLAFELTTACEGLCEKDRWSKLIEFFFETKKFHALSSSSWPNVTEKDLLMKHVLANCAGHAFPITLLFLHLSLAIALPIHLVEARQKFIVKFCYQGQTSYLDIARGRVLTETEIFQILQNTTSNLETWDARGLYRQYLEELMKLFESQAQSQMLHTIYNLYLHLDESNLPVLGRRALLRQRMGFIKEALTDLKRYFSFVERGHAPIEIQRAMVDLEAIAEDQISREAIPSSLLH